MSERIPLQLWTMTDIRSSEAEPTERSKGFKFVVELGKWGY